MFFYKKLLLVCFFMPLLAIEASTNISENKPLCAEEGTCTCQLDEWINVWMCEPNEHVTDFPIVCELVPPEGCYLTKYCSYTCDFDIFE